MFSQQPVAPTKFDKTTYDIRTQWPDGFDPVNTTAVFVPQNETQLTSLRDIAEALTAYVGVPAAGQAPKFL
jgi:hypothetical protein